MNFHRPSNTKWPYDAHMARIVIVVGYARQSTYCEFLGEAYRRGAMTAGHSVSIYVLSKLTFDPILHHGFSKDQPLEPDIKDAQAAIGAADHLVIIFPLWFGTLPAILKGFIERILQPGFAIQTNSSFRGYKPLLKGKSPRAIVTMGIPGWLYKWLFGSHAIRMLRRNILKFVGISPVRTQILGGVEAVSEVDRAQWVREVEAFCAAAR